MVIRIRFLDVYMSDEVPEDSDRNRYGDFRFGHLPDLGDPSGWSRYMQWVERAEIDCLGAMVYVAGVFQGKRGTIYGGEWHLVYGRSEENDQISTSPSNTVPLSAIRNGYRCLYPETNPADSVPEGSLARAAKEKPPDGDPTFRTSPDTDYPEHVSIP